LRFALSQRSLLAKEWTLSVEYAGSMDRRSGGAHEPQNPVLRRVYEKPHRFGRARIQEFQLYRAATRREFDVVMAWSVDRLRSLHPVIFCLVMLWLRFPFDTADPLTQKLLWVSVVAFLHAAYILLFVNEAGAADAARTYGCQLLLCTELLATGAPAGHIRSASAPA
jgi:hypothetical protein